MRKLFFDIETLPAEKDKHSILHEIHRRLADDGKKVEEIESFIAKTSLDGAFGRIACLSYVIDDGPVKTLCGDEKKILQDFWEVAKEIDLFIGFNILDFDLRFIYQRSVVLGVKPTRELNFARYRNSPIYDVMREWAKWDMQDKISLDTLAKVLSLPSSKGGSIEGKDVAKVYKDGRIKEICEYCEKDVELTRKIYNKMTFEDPSLGRQG